MKQMPQVCREIQEDLVAAAVQEAGARARARVQDHVARCAPCRGEFDRYRVLDETVGTLKREPAPAVETAARAELQLRLVDLRRRLLTYGVFDSPLGRILIGRTEQGVSLVRYLGRGGVPRLPGLEAVADGAEIERLYWELLEYLRGRRTRLEWPLDLCLARSDFHRTVLELTARIPYGAVTSYANVARELGRPAAVRAVAQALRTNPVPIAIPCHRVVGADGGLTGYAGKRIGLKQRLLAVEGVQTMRQPGDFRVVREAMYVRDREDVEYCLPTCGVLPRRSLAELTLFASRERAEACGLHPCTSCRPDLHPLPR
ncbi:MAG: methylated-DNA--[protein]-cysteine S-methyltransferase [Candidatus Rokubacteria bacterium]|nr:methylated-DNA--[protein]-cysteine S-methyltransferase [Candidatus Rokubacteria bacterium]